jgi:hypothetical protein
MQPKEMRNGADALDEVANILEQLSSKYPKVFEELQVRYPLCDELGGFAGMLREHAASVDLGAKQETAIIQSTKPAASGPSIDDLSLNQRAALIEFRIKNGRSWKEKLHEGWLRAAYPGALQQIRNEFGPAWLNKLKHVPEYRLQVTLKASDGNEGTYSVSLNTSGRPTDGCLVWSPAEPDAMAYTESVSIKCYDGTEINDYSDIDGDTWRALEDGDRCEELWDRVLKGEPLKAAVEEISDMDLRPRM